MAFHWPGNDGLTTHEKNKKEKQMSEQESSAPTAAPQGTTLSAAQLQNLLSVVLEEARKPYVDEDAKKLKESRRLRLRAAMLEMQAAEKARQVNCTHLREDNTSCIAWMVNTDGITRGFCPHCCLVIDEKHPKRAELLRVPTRRPSIVGV